MSLSTDAKFVSSSHQQARDQQIPLFNFGTRLRRTISAWATRRRWAREVETLHAFSDKELWDIGLGRSDLMSISNGTFSRD